MANTDRTWLITGCSTGFGRELVLELIERGERIVATARRPDAIADLAAAAPDRVLALELDVTKPATIEAAVAAAEARFGGIDVLVNNAGFAVIGGVEEVPDEIVRAIRSRGDDRCLEPSGVSRAATVAARSRRPRSSRDSRSGWCRGRWR